MQDYIEQAIRTESVVRPEFGPATSRLLHAAMGMVTESGEFMDVLKKHIFYGKVVDEINLKEELGDIMWYMAIACDVLGTDFETEMQRNIAKLRERYPSMFDSEHAINRDLDAERAVLEIGDQRIELKRIDVEPDDAFDEANDLTRI